MKCESTTSLLLARDPDAANWEVLIQHRLKNGRPQTIYPQGEELRFLNGKLAKIMFRVKSVPAGNIR